MNKKSYPRATHATHAKSTTLSPPSSSSRLTFPCISPRSSSVSSLSPFAPLFSPLSSKRLLFALFASLATPLVLSPISRIRSLVSAYSLSRLSLSVATSRVFLSLRPILFPMRVKILSLERLQSISVCFLVPCRGVSSRAFPNRFPIETKAIALSLINVRRSTRRRVADRNKTKSHQHSQHPHSRGENRRLFATTFVLRTPQPTRQRRVCFVDKSIVSEGKKEIFLLSSASAMSEDSSSVLLLLLVLLKRYALCYCICCCIRSLSLFLSLKLSLSPFDVVFLYFKCYSSKLYHRLLNLSSCSPRKRSRSRRRAFSSVPRIRTASSLNRPSPFRLKR